SFPPLRQRIHSDTKVHGFLAPRRCVMNISLSLADVSKRLTIVATLFLLLVVGCGQKSNEPSTTADGKTGEANKQASRPGLVDRLSNKAITVPAGTVITVRTKEALGSK